jgi:hypothetical protein
MDDPPLCGTTPASPSHSITSCPGGGPSHHLWDATGYNYAAYVTAVDWASEDVVAFYDKRADLEKAIPKLKKDFGIDRIPSSSFGATAADLELKVLAFNRLGLYQRQALGWAVRQRAKTLRRRVLALAGLLIRTVSARPSHVFAKHHRARCSLWPRTGERGGADVPPMTRGQRSRPSTPARRTRRYQHSSHGVSSRTPLPTGPQ